jgi:hypothetical protein
LQQKGASLGQADAAAQEAQAAKRSTEAARGKLPQKLTNVIWSKANDDCAKLVNRMLCGDLDFHSKKVALRT